LDVFRATNWHEGEGMGIQETGLRTTIKGKNTESRSDELPTVGNVKGKENGSLLLKQRACRQATARYTTRDPRPKDIR